MKGIKRLKSLAGCLLVAGLMISVLFGLLFMLGSNESNVAYADNLSENHIHTGCCVDLRTHESESQIQPYNVSTTEREFCNTLGNTHGKGREQGYTNEFLTTGCGNYMGFGFTYGISDIPYYVDSSTMSESLANTIRAQANMWNQAIMHDGTGQIVNLYEVASPEKINNRPVTRVFRGEEVDPVTKEQVAGMFKSTNDALTILIDSARMKVDTPAHEFGHLLGLGDLDGYDTGLQDHPQHKVLMGYQRGTTEETLQNTIKYQDIQGIAVMNNRHTNHSFFRYVKDDRGKYIHFCFYCDMIDVRYEAGLYSAEMLFTNVCDHAYAKMVSHGSRIWVKCTKCYKVVETDEAHLPALIERPSNLTPLFNGGTGTKTDPFLIDNEQQFRNIGYAYQPFYRPYEGNVNLIASHFKLTKNIVLNGDWAPFPYEFIGSLDGDGHSVTYHMTLDQSDTSEHNFGLFGFVSNVAMIKNLKLLNCSITSDISQEFTCKFSPSIGILAGSIYEAAGGISDIVIENPTINCNFKNAAIGGIAGSLYGTSVNNCKVIGGSITSYSGSLGGMAGFGDINEFVGGECNTTITKNNYSDDDLVGPIVGNSQERSSVGGSTTIQNDKKCLAAGTLITLADGRQVPVETLTGNEMLLVWNLNTGTFDTAPILFIDSDPEKTYQVIDLSFSDGTSVAVVYEHGFWDFNLNKYVYLDKNASQYLGHWFAKQGTDGNGNPTSFRVQLTEVEIRNEVTAVYSPVTYGHLCYYVNGMLSMPGGIEGLFNVFEVNAETMRYDEEAMQADIAEYGLFTFEEFRSLVAVSEEVFSAFNGQYLKVAIGKGLISVDALNTLAVRYADFLN